MPLPFPMTDPDNLLPPRPRFSSRLTDFILPTEVPEPKKPDIKEILKKAARPDGSVNWSQFFVMLAALGGTAALGAAVGGTKGTLAAAGSGLSGLTEGYQEGRKLDAELKDRAVRTGLSLRADERAATKAKEESTERTARMGLMGKEEERKRLTFESESLAKKIDRVQETGVPDPDLSDPLNKSAVDEYNRKLEERKTEQDAKKSLAAYHRQLGQAAIARDNTLKMNTAQLRMAMDNALKAWQNALHDSSLTGEDRSDIISETKANYDFYKQAFDDALKLEGGESGTGKGGGFNFVQDMLQRKGLFGGQPAAPIVQPDTAAAPPDTARSGLFYNQPVRKQLGLPDVHATQTGQGGQKGQPGQPKPFNEKAVRALIAKKHTWSDDRVDEAVAELMRTMGMSSEDAVKWLAKDNGILY